MIFKELEKRKLPPLKSREEMIEIMQREVYGYMPDVEFDISASEPEILERRFASFGEGCSFHNGKVFLSRVNLTVSTKQGSHTFKVSRLLHTDGKKRPTILMLNFYPGITSPYIPLEELTEYETDYLFFNYKDLATDDSDFSNGLAPLLIPNGQETETTCGKIMIWAWGAMRVLDYALTLPSTDPENVAILGHSRLGKTALVAAMMDERFKYCFSNNSGCAGAAIAHGSTGLTVAGSIGTPERGENICDVTDNFAYWFCKNYLKYRDKMYADDFDQHFLIASIAPRYVVVGSNKKDDWADQKSEQLACLAASEAWEKNGKSGLVGCERFLDAGEALLEGSVGYFMVDFLHFLSRHNWHRYLEFIEKHKK